MNNLKFPTHKFLTLNDSRKISYYEAGPSAGNPILFCTGAAMSGVLGFGISELEKLNIRLTLGKHYMQDYRMLSDFF